jgi:hypothetical protein
VVESSLTLALSFSVSSLTVTSIPELSILFFVTRGSFKRIRRTCASITSPQESEYSRDDINIFFAPFSENGSQNLISMHFQYSMPYRSIVTHLPLNTEVSGKVPPDE